MKARVDDRDDGPTHGLHSALECEAHALERTVPRSASSAGGMRGRTRWRPAFWIVGTVAMLLAWPHSLARHAPGPPSTWDLEISADGEQSVTALVYGTVSGVHLITVPGANAAVTERRHLPIRPAAGEVHLVSLGWNGLSIRTDAPPGGLLISATARARSVTLYSNATGSGVRTGW